MHRFHGAWRITVTTRDAHYEQRAVVRGRYGTRVLPGTVGAALTVDEQDWTLTLEHQPHPGTWRPDLRTAAGPVTREGARVSVTVTGNDCHQGGKPYDYVNFAVRLERLDTDAGADADAQAGATVPAHRLTAAPLTPARPSTSGTPSTPGTPAPLRTSSDGHPAPGIPRQRPAVGTRTQPHPT
ncbi:hypothetical protein [Kitasatospora sp. NPDC101183]|uniref:hypothetical protein n=1 Tax=Kitasatospora sp. NPDC101183 TaxID=3364100 RepID=UPI0037F87D82